MWFCHSQRGTTIPQLSFAVYTHQFISPSFTFLSSPSSPFLPPANKLHKQQQAKAPTSTAREREDGEDAALEAPRKAAAIGRRKGAAAVAADPNTNDAGETGDETGSAAAPSLGLSVLGSAWVERHKDIVEHYGAAYQEKTWRPLITALEAILVTEVGRARSPMCV